MSAGYAFGIISIAFGILVGEIADFVFDWANDNDIENRIAFIPQTKSLLHWLEHYHWGMTLMGLYSFGLTYFPDCSTPICDAFRYLTDSPFLIGFGLSLILDENRSDTRFAWEKNPGPHYHFYESSMLGIGIAVIIICRWLMLVLHWLAVTVAIVIALLFIVLHERIATPVKTVFPRTAQQAAFEEMHTEA